jgi:hypothetical protein
MSIFAAIIRTLFFVCLSFTGVGLCIVGMFGDNAEYLTAGAVIVFGLIIAADVAKLVDYQEKARAAEESTRKLQGEQARAKAVVEYRREQQAGKRLGKMIGENQLPPDIDFDALIEKELGLSKSQKRPELSSRQIDRQQHQRPRAETGE